MPQEPLISIAMATYNGGCFLREQLNSIYAQTYKNVEVIVTDDCSNDSTIGLLEEYKKNHGLRYFINDKNLGYLKNFERAISLCTGDYIALSDQDDIWLPDKLESLLDAIDGRSLVFSDAKLIDEDGNIFSESFHQYQNVFIPKYLEHFNYLAIKNFITGCTVLFSRKLLKEISPIPKEALHHDWWISFLASLKDGIEYVKKPLVLYRQHGGNSIGAHKSSFLKNLLKEARFAFEKRGKRKKRNKQKVKRLNCFKEKLLFLGLEGNREIEFLEQIFVLYSSKNFFKKFIISLKNRQVLFPNKGSFGRIIASLAKAFF